MKLPALIGRTTIGAALVVLAAFATLSIATTAPAHAQQGPDTIELETIEIESEVPRRVAQFFVQRDRLHYQPLDDQPTFMPELLKTVDEEPF